MAVVSSDRDYRQPRPISLEPSGKWNTLDGSWSTFTIDIGISGQRVQVLPSADLSPTLIIETPREAGEWTERDSFSLPTSSYPHTHNEFFDRHNSTTWREISCSTISKALCLKNADDMRSIELDTITLENTDATAIFELQSQVLGTLSASSSGNNFLSLNYRSGNFNNYDETHPSFLATLKSERLIPSVSWSYTAGAAYRSPRSRNSLESLILGEYDSSRFMPNDVSFPILDDAVGDLTVGLQSIEASKPNGTTMPLLPSPIVAHIDSTVSHI